MITYDVQRAGDVVFPAESVAAPESKPLFSESASENISACLDFIREVHAMLAGNCTAVPLAPACIYDISGWIYETKMCRFGDD